VTETAQITDPARPRRVRVRPRRRGLVATAAAYGSGVLLLLFLVLAAFGPELVSGNPLAQSSQALLSIGARGHLLGTDDLGRDELVRLVYGARPLITVALASALTACAVGTTVGLIAGFRGGWLDQLLMRCTDLALAFPSILLIILVVTVLGTGAGTLIIGIGIAMAPGFARFGRALTIRETGRDYVAAARIGGTPALRIMFVDILPNIFGSISVQLVSTVSLTAGYAAGLSYIGLGIQPPEADWGYMVQAGQSFIYSAPQLVVLPALCTLLFVVACNYVGDALRDATDAGR
jgi:ABC-type dipeptide/oligopeptide/nickel transport system permease subunit